MKPAALNGGDKEELREERTARRSGMEIIAAVREGSKESIWETR